MGSENMGMMTKIVSGVIGATVSVIVVSTVLAPTVTDATGSGGTLTEYAGLLGAVLVLSIVAILMIAVRLITGSRD